MYLFKWAVMFEVSAGILCCSDVWIALVKKCYLVWCLTDIVFENDIKGSFVFLSFHPETGLMDTHYTHLSTHTQTQKENEEKDHTTVIRRAKQDKLQSLMFSLWCTSITACSLVPSYFVSTFPGSSDTQHREVVLTIFSVFGRSQ